MAFSISTFNVLADGAAQSGGFRTPMDLSWEARKTALLAAVPKTDIICLQECNHFLNFWVPALKDYTGAFAPKARYAAYQAVPDGVAIFIRSTRFQTIRTAMFYSNPVQCILLLWDTETKQTIVVMSVHLKAKPEFADQRTTQVQTAWQRRADFYGLGVPTLWTGDFNAEPTEACVKYLCQRGFTYMTFNWTTWKTRQTTVKHAIDYIFYSAAVQCTPIVEYTSLRHIPDTGLPTPDHPSDHRAVAATVWTRSHCDVG